MALGTMPVAAIAETAQGAAVVSTKAGEQKTGYLSVSFVDQDGKTIADTKAFEGVTIGTKISDLKDEVAASVDQSKWELVDIVDYYGNSVLNSTFSYDGMSLTAKFKPADKSQIIVDLHDENGSGILDADGNPLQVTIDASELEGYQLSSQAILGQVKGKVDSSKFEFSKLLDAKKDDVTNDAYYGGVLHLTAVFKTIPSVEWTQLTVTYVDQYGDSVDGFENGAVVVVEKGYQFSSPYLKGLITNGVDATVYEFSKILDADGQDITNDAATKDAQDITVVFNRKQAQKFTVSYYASTGDDLLGTEEYEKGSYGWLGGVKAPEQDGYEFVGWKYTGDSDDHLIDDSKTQLLGNVSVQPVYKQKAQAYKVTYWDGMDVIGEAETYAGEYNWNYVTPAPKEGYVFLGWKYTGDTDDHLIDFATTPMGSADVNVEAVWKKADPKRETYKVTYWDGMDVIGEAETYAGEYNWNYVTPAPKAGYDFLGWKWTGDTDDHLIDFTKTPMPESDVNVEAVWKKTSVAPNPGNPSNPGNPTTPEKHKFDDVVPGEWYEDGVNFVYEKGLMLGYEGTNIFGVGQPLTRGQMATILFRYANPNDKSDYHASKNETGLADVADGQFYTPAANWAVKNGVINGYDNPDGTRTFGADDPITFEQYVQMVANLTADGADEDSDLTLLDKFTDGGKVSDWAKKAMAWAASNGLVEGIDNWDGTRTIDPSAAVARERAATVFMRAYDLKLMK